MAGALGMVWPDGIPAQVRTGTRLAMQAARPDGSPRELAAAIEVIGFNNMDQTVVSWATWVADLYPSAVVVGGSPGERLAEEMIKAARDGDGNAVSTMAVCSIPQVQLDAFLSLLRLLDVSGFDPEVLV